MALKITQIGDQIKAVIRKQSAKIVKEQTTTIQKQMEKAATDWQSTVRAALGVQVPEPWDQNTPRNLSLWPKRRTGNLQMSILRPTVKWTTRNKDFIDRHGKASIEFSISGFYGPIAAVGYGNKLDTMRDFSADEENSDLGVKPFAGWKHRASSLLFAFLHMSAKIRR